MQNSADLLTLLQLRDALEDFPTERLAALKVAIAEYLGRHRDPSHVAIVTSLEAAWAPTKPKGKPIAHRPHG